MWEVIFVHVAVLAALALGACAFLRIAYRRRRSIIGEVLDRLLLLSIGMLWLIVTGCYLITRRTLHPFEASGIVVLIAPLALSMRRVPLRAILYYWGIALGARAILNPTHIAPISLDFVVYWLAHAAIIVAVSYDLIVNRYKPSLKSCGWACVTAWVYIAICLPANSNPPQLFYEMLLLAGGFVLLTIPWLLRPRTSPRPVVQPVSDLDDSELIYST